MLTGSKFQEGRGERRFMRQWTLWKDNEQQNIIFFQVKAYITEIDNLIILLIMNIKRIDDYALLCKIETLNV